MPSDDPKQPVRDEWDIKEDLRAVERTLEVFDDKERLADVQTLIKKNKIREKKS